MSVSEKIRRVCVTRGMKQRRAFRRRAGMNATLFNGTIHFVNVSFGDVRLGDSDMAAGVQYAILSAQVIQNYCSQYGATKLNVDNRVYSFSWPSSSFSDADLQTWVGTVSKQFNFPAQDAVVFLAPPGANNTDAPLSSGVLGYHNATGIHQPYIYVNLVGTPLVIDDRADFFATALSHEIAEMLVDPLADLSNPEVCDPCAGNCNVDNRNYFNAQGGYIGGGGAPGVGSPSTWTFYTDGVATPYAVQNCPAPAEACRYDPNTPPQAPPPAPGPGACIQQIKNGVATLEQGNIVAGIVEIVQGVECLLSGGHLTESAQPALDAARIRLHVRSNR